MFGLLECMLVLFSLLVCVGVMSICVCMTLVPVYVCFWHNRFTSGCRAHPCRPARKVFSRCQVSPSGRRTRSTCPPPTPAFPASTSRYTRQRLSCEPSFFSLSRRSRSVSCSCVTVACIPGRREWWWCVCVVVVSVRVPVYPALTVGCAVYLGLFVAVQSRISGPL